MGNGLLPGTQIDIITEAGRIFGNVIYVNVFEQHIDMFSNLSLKKLILGTKRIFFKS